MGRMGRMGWVPRPFTAVAAGSITPLTAAGSMTEPGESSGGTNDGGDNGENDDGNGGTGGHCCISFAETARREASQN